MKTEIKLPEGYITRAAVKDDFGAVADLINTSSREICGEQFTSLEDKTNAWETPGFNISTDTQLVLNREGVLIGLLEFWDIQEPHLQATVHLHLHPEYDPILTGDYLLSWGDRRAETMLEIAPAGQKLDLLIMVDGRDENKGMILEENGYNNERTFWRMLLEMDSPPPLKELPGGFSIRNHKAGQDDQTMHEVIEAAFKDHWRHVPLAYEQWSHWNLEDEEFDPHLWFIAFRGEQAGGGLMAWGTYNGEADTGWISDLGVLREWRGQGIAEALLSRAFNAFYQKGSKKVVLEVDTDSQTGALGLYEKVGMKPIGKNFVYEKNVRPSE